MIFAGVHMPLVKVDPHGGMRVTWLTPEEAPEIAELLQRMRDEIGKENLRVYYTKYSQENGWLVTLQRDGNPITMRYGSARESRIRRQEVTQIFSWNLLRPLQAQEMLSKSA